MSILINCIRNMLGAIIYLLDLVTRPRKLKRDAATQARVDQEVANLALYQFTLCPFCIKTRRAIHKLNLPIETRNISKHSPFRDELIKHGGKVQAPCLRIGTGEQSQWLYESSEIIRYLEQQFA